MRKTIVDEITSSVNDFCAGKYSLVLDKSGTSLNGTPSVLYTEGLTDLTEEIVKILNSKKPSE
ncbi:MAG: hypothetical protein AAFY98_00900 [Verrucomicrobiota bacterium]